MKLHQDKNAFRVLLEQIHEQTYTFPVSSSDTRIRVALSYLKRSTHSSGAPTNINSGSLYNLDLKVSGPGGTKQSTSTKNNLEIIDFEAPTPGTYTITITLKQATASNVHYAVAWR